MNLKNTYRIFFLLLSVVGFSQQGTRVAYVDIDYILDNLQEYKLANQQFSERVAFWQHEFEEKNKEIQIQKEKLQAEKPLLTNEIIKDREEEIGVLENALEELKQKRFAPETGDYIKQKWHLVQPIQDQIFNIAQEIGKSRKFDYIFTKTDVASVYADQKFDITRLVLRILNRKDNAEDRNKDISTLLKETYNYELKDEKTRKKEEAQQRRQEQLGQARAERETKKKQTETQKTTQPVQKTQAALDREAKRQEQQKQREEQQKQEEAEKEQRIKERQQARERLQKERQQAQEKQKNK